MPYKSKAQMRKFYAMVSRGEMSKSTADEWAKETPSIKRLPERIKKKKSPKERYAQFLKNQE